MAGDAEFFMNEKPVRALIAVVDEENAYATAVSDRIDTTYSHTTVILGELESREYVKRDDQGDGRKKYIEATEKGRKVAGLFRDVLDEVDGSEVYM